MSSGDIQKIHSEPKVAVNHGQIEMKWETPLSVKITLPVCLLPELCKSQMNTQDAILIKKQLAVCYGILLSSSDLIIDP